MSFVFYDTETTGTQTAFDQILQFAAIRTDDELQELERFDIRCRLMPHVVPAPGALRVTGVTPAMLTDPRLPSHDEAIGRIRDTLAGWGPAVFIGYNSLRFDEDLLRQALFQTLRPPYLTNTDGNARADVLHFVQAAAVYVPDALTVPTDARGKPTLKLERLAPANGYAHDAAHEAVADVEATIHMARLVKQRAPEVWHRLMASCRKAEALRLATGHRPYALTEVRTTAPVVCCGRNPDHDAQVAAFDLRNDPGQFLDRDVDHLIALLAETPKVIRTVRANAQPIIMPLDRLPEAVRAGLPSDDVLAARARAVQADDGFQTRVGQAMAGRYAAEAPAAYVEQRIYEGFPGRADQALMGRFRQTDWAARADIAAQFEDARLRELARRLIFLEAPGALDDEQRAAMQDWLRRRVLAADPAVPWTTLPKAIAQAEALLEQAGGADAVLMTEVRAFLEQLADRHSR